MDDPKHVAARRITKQAIRQGVLVKKPCEVCGETKVEVHHVDYSDPLNVKWLCRKHHIETFPKTHKRSLKPNQKVISRTFSLHPSQLTIIKKLAENIAKRQYRTHTESAALRMIIKEWSELSRMNEIP